MFDNELYLYADDSTLFAPIKTSVNSKTVVASLNRDLSNMKEWAASLNRDLSNMKKWAASLNRDLTNMKEWADRLKVTFKPTKCKTMILSRKRTPSKLDLYFSDCKLPN